MAKSFADHIVEERDRINSDMKQLQAQRQEIDGKLADLRRELSAVDAYENARVGRKKQGRRVAGRRDNILTIIKDSNGISRAQILEAAGVKGDKGGEQSVSNALSNLKKQKKIVAEGGLYRST